MTSGLDARSSIDSVKNFFQNSAQTKELTGHRKKVHSVAWNSNGKKLASGSVDQTARIWMIDPASTTVKDMELKGHTNSVDQLCWDPTHSEHLSTASVDKTVRLWDARTGKCTSVINTPGENINIAWSPNGTYLAVGNKEDDIIIIDSRKSAQVDNKKFSYEVNEIAWHPKGDALLLTTGYGTIELTRWPLWQKVHSLQAHTANCYCIEFDPQGKYFASGGADALVSLWDTKDMVCLRTFGRLDWPVRTLSFSHDSALLASASEDLVIDISHVETGALVHQIACKAAMNTVAWHPKQYLLAFAGDEKDKHGKDEGYIKIFGFSDNPSSSSSSSSSSSK